MLRLVLVGTLILVLGFGLVVDYYLSPAQQVAPTGSASTSASSTNSISSTGTGTGSLSLAATVPVGASPYGLAYDPSNGDVFVGVSGANSVAVVNNQSQVVDEVPVGGAADFLAYDTADSLLYAALVGNNSVSVINPASGTVVSTISVPTSSGWLAYDPAGGQVYSVNRESNLVSVISGTTVTKTIPISGLPFAAAYDLSNGDMYVTDNLGAVFVIDGANGTLLDTVQLAGPSSNLLGIAYNPSDQMMYATDYTDGAVYILNGTQPAGVIPGFDEPIGIAFNASGSEMYAVNSGNSTVTAIAGGVPSTLPVGSSPREALFDPSSGLLVVSNYGNSTLSLLRG